MAWRITDYNMQSISHKTEASINREYNRLKNIVEKRVSTFEKHGKGNLQHVRNIKNSVSGNVTVGDRAHSIIEMKRFLSLQQSSYSSWEKSMKKTIEYFTGLGIEGLNMGTIEAFMDFLDWTRSFYGYYHNYDVVMKQWNEKIKTGDIEGMLQFFSEKISGGISNS